MPDPQGCGVGRGVPELLRVPALQEMGRSRGSRCGEYGLRGGFSEPRGFPELRKVPAREVPLSRGWQRGGGGVKVAPAAPGAGSSRALPMGLYWEFAGSCPQHALEFPELPEGFPHS